MKILFFSHGKRANGGAERCLLDLIKGIKQAHESWEIYVVFPGQDELWEMSRPYLSGYAFIRQPWWLVRPKKNGWRKRLLFNIQKRENITHYWFIHEIPPLARNLVYLFNEGKSLKQVGALSQKIIVPSDFVGEYYKAHFPEAGKIEVVYQSVDIVPPARPRVDQPFTIGMLANFEPNKGQHIAIEAFREVVKEYPDTHLLLIGGNHSRYAQEIKESVIAYKLESNVSIVEHTIHPHDYLIQADAALVCSGFECFGRVIVEGLKCGLPVVVPDKPFGRELIREGYNGFLYNRDDAHDLARKIILLRRQDLSTLKQNALDSVENRFSVHSFAQDFTAIINPAKS